MPRTIPARGRTTIRSRTFSVGQSVGGKGVVGRTDDRGLLGKGVCRASLEN